MTKKLILAALVLFLLLAACVHADAISDVTNPRTGDKYNVGDDIIITGTIIPNETISGAIVTFSLYSKILDTTIPISTKYYTFTEGIPATFSLINKGLLSWTVPNDIRASEDWKVLVHIQKDNETIEKFESGIFRINRQLFLSLSTNARLFNLGETLEVSGTVLRARGLPVEGTASVSLDEEGAGSIAADTFDMKNGYFAYTRAFAPTDPKGSYSLSIEITDTDGNRGSYTFSDLTMSNELSLSCTLETEKIAPGDIVTIIGNIRNVHDSPVKETLNAWVTDPKQSATTKHTTESDVNGNFAFEIQMPKLAMPGVYSARIEASDEHGNKGECTKGFSTSEIKQMRIPSVDFNRSATIYPGDLVNISIALINDGNVDLDGTTNVYVGDTKAISKGFSLPRGESKKIATTWNVSVNPGNYTLTVEALSTLGEKLYETEGEQFAISARPVPPKKFKFTSKHALFLLILLVIAMLLYFKKKTLKEFFWRRELRGQFRKKKPLHKRITRGKHTGTE